MQPLMVYHLSAGGREQEHLLSKLSQSWFILMISEIPKVLDFILPFNPASVIILAMGKEALAIFLSNFVFILLSDSFLHLRI